MGTPLRRARLRCSLVPSSTRPMSRMRMGVPASTAEPDGATPRVRSRDVGDHQVLEGARVGVAAHRAQHQLLAAGVDVAAGHVGVLLGQGLRARSVMGSWYAARRSASIQMLMARSRPPTTRTSPTPLVRSSCTRTVLSASSVSSRSERSPESAMVRTGELSLSNFWTTGGVASSGRRLTTVLTRSRTSWAAVSRLRSSLKVAITIDMPGSGDRAQLVDAVDGVDHLLDLLGEERLHLLGRGAGQHRAHVDASAGRRTDSGRRRGRSTRSRPPPPGRGRASRRRRDGGCRSRPASAWASRGPRPRRALAGGAPATTTGWPDWRLPGASTTWSPTDTPESDLRPLRGAAAGGHRLLDRLAVLHGDDLLQAGEGDDGAAGHGGGLARTGRSR